MECLIAGLAPPKPFQRLDPGQLLPLLSSFKRERANRPYRDFPWVVSSLGPGSAGSFVNVELIPNKPLK
jgi:hypothetical protein